jgi:hypothetical protein
MRFPVSLCGLLLLFLELCHRRLAHARCPVTVAVVGWLRTRERKERNGGRGGQEVKRIKTRTSGKTKRVEDRGGAA